MTEDTWAMADADDILDSVTLKIAKTLLENPKIQYNKTTLAKAAGVSKDALYDRWDSLVKGGLIEKADVESEVEHWQLNQNTSSPLPEALSQIMYVVGNEEDNR